MKFIKKILLKIREKLNKKNVIKTTAVFAVMGLAYFSLGAFEVKFLGVTAKIASVIEYQIETIDFGEVLPGDYMEEDFVISLSDNFINSSSTNELSYTLVQKAKALPTYEAEVGEADAQIYCDANMEDSTKCYYDINRFLSIHDDRAPDNDEDLGAFTMDTDVEGLLSKSANDLEDIWVLDFNAPFFEGQSPANFPYSDEYLLPMGTELLGGNIFLSVDPASDPAVLTGITTGSTIPTGSRQEAIARWGDGGGGDWEINVDGDTEDMSWDNGGTKSGTLHYDPLVDEIIFTLDGVQVSAVALVPTPDGTITFAGTAIAGNNNHAKIENIQIDGVSISETIDAHDGNTNTIVVDDALLTNGYDISFNVILAWDGTPSSTLGVGIYVQ